MENQITHTYHVSGMNCGGCAATVKNLLSNAKGVTTVKIDLAKKEAEITSSQVLKVDALQEALSNTSYNITELRAPIAL